LGGVEGEGLFGVDVFAGLERAGVYGGVGGGDGEVENEIDVGRGEKLVDRERADAMFAGLGLGTSGIEVGAGDDLDEIIPGGTGEILIADYAATDETEVDRGTHGK